MLEAADEESVRVCVFALCVLLAHCCVHSVRGMVTPCLGLLPASTARNIPSGFLAKLLAVAGSARLALQGLLGFPHGGCRFASSNLCTILPC